VNSLRLVEAPPGERLGELGGAAAELEDAPRVSRDGSHLPGSELDGDSLERRVVFFFDDVLS